MNTRASGTVQIPELLSQQIHAGNCVAFLGAGFSAAARLPSWGELLERIAAEANASPEISAHVSERVRRGTAHALDEAAQSLEDGLGRPTFVSSLGQILGRPEINDAMDQRLRWLRGIPFRLILTTNFDGVLDGHVADHRTYRDALRPDPHGWWDRRHTAEGRGALVVKLHGALSGSDGSSDTIVLTRRDYRRRLYQDAAYATFLRALFATSTILYLGFSFEDAYLNELRSEVLALLGHAAKSAPVAYAVVSDAPPPTRAHFLQHEGIELLAYDSRQGRDHSGFEHWLEALYQSTNPTVRFGRHLAHRRVLWVDPNPENNVEAFRFLAAAAEASGRGKHALECVDSAEAGLNSLRREVANGGFDLVLTHWGDGAARDDRGERMPTAVRLMRGMRAEDLRAPVLVFASARDAEARRRVALGLGAVGYCFRFEALFRAIDAVFSPAREVG